MKKLTGLLVLVAFTVILAACSQGGATRQEPQAMGGAAAMAPGAKAAPTGGSAIYFCDCGPECKCNTVSTLPGSCGCGKKLAGGHVIGMEGNTALVCPCGPTCACSVDPKDPTKCGCGKDIKRVNLEGTGIYFCNCGGSCGCNTISDKPGACKCGMPLHQAK